MATEATRYIKGMRLVPPLQFFTLPGINKLPEIDLECRILTPMVGGGIVAMEPDPRNLARATAIRGSWRWWFRAVCPGSEEEVRQKETVLFGGVGKEALSSLVRVHTQVTHHKIEPAGYHTWDNVKAKLRTLPNWDSDIGYGLFPLQRTDKERKACREDSMPTRNVVTELKFRVEIRVHPQLWKKEGSKELLQLGLEALRWWSHFGGIGGRTRRGFGAVELLACTKNTFDGFKKERLLESPSVPGGLRASSPLCGAQILEAKNICENPIDAHKKAIGFLRNFRQKEGLARDPGTKSKRPGRSRWPEPTLLKRIVEAEAKTVNQAIPRWEHPPQINGHPETLANLGVPRAAFGMPLLIRFKDQQDSLANADLLPTEDNRWPSPVLLRPHKTSDGKYKARFLILSGFSRVGYGQAQPAEILVCINNSQNKERHRVYTFHRHHPSLAPYFLSLPRQDAVLAFAKYLTQNGYKQLSNSTP